MHIFHRASVGPFTEHYNPHWTYFEFVAWSFAMSDVSKIYEKIT